MPIIAKGRFRSTTSPTGSLTLPSDNAAAPYRALANLGEGMVSVASRIYQSNKAAEAQAEADRAREAYNMQHAKLSLELENNIDDEANVGGVPYSEVYSAREADIKKSLEKSLTSDRARSIFNHAISGTSSHNNVSALVKQNNHWKANYNGRFKKKALGVAREIVVSTNDGNNTLLETTQTNLQNSLVPAMEDLTIGKISDADYKALEVDAGTVQASALLDNIVTAADITGMNALTGTEFLDPETRKYAKEEGLEDVMQIIEESRKALGPRANEDYEKYSYLRQFLTPAEMTAAKRSFLRNLKMKNSVDMAAKNARFRNILISLGAKSTYDSQYSGNESDRARIKNLNIEAHNIIQEYIDAGVNPNIVASKAMALKLASVKHAVGRQLYNAGPQQAERIQSEGLRSYIENVKEQVTSEFPQLAGAVQETMGAEAEQALSNVYSTEAKGIVDGLQSNPVGLISAFDKGVAIRYSNPLGLNARDFSKVRTIQKNKGVRGENVQFLTPEASDTIGKHLEALWGAPTESQEAMATTIVQLQQQWGEYTPTIMNEVAEKGDIKDSTKALSAVMNINNQAVMRDALTALAGYDIAKANYESSNITSATLGKAKRITNFEAMRADLLRDVKVNFNRAVLRNRGIEWNTYEKLIDAEFYRKTGGVASSKDPELYKAAIERMFGKHHIQASRGNSAVVLPKKMGVTKSRAKAAIPVIKKRAKKLKVDVEKFGDPILKAMKKAKVPDKDIQQRFQDVYGDKGYVTTSGVAGNGHTLIHYTETERGSVATPFIIDGETKPLMLRSSEILNNTEIDAQEAKDNQGFLDFIFGK